MAEFNSIIKITCYVIGILAILTGTVSGLIGIWTTGLNELLMKTTISAVVIFSGACGALFLSCAFETKKPNTSDLEKDTSND